MKTIIAGCRDFTDYKVVERAVQDSCFCVTEVVSGMATGVDTLGVRYAEEHGLPLKAFPADWARHGRAAGPMRNQDMASYADALIAVWDGKSAGTSSMIKTARQHHLRVFIMYV